jgi:hypothetical protein
VRPFLRLDVFERLEHFRDEVFSDFDEALVLGFVDGVHQLAVRTLQIALDVVVFEVVHRLGLVACVIACFLCVRSPHPSEA